VKLAGLDNADKFAAFAVTQPSSDKAAIKPENCLGHI
jgi:hypothetical protein